MHTSGARADEGLGVHKLSSALLPVLTMLKFVELRLSRIASSHHVRRSCVDLLMTFGKLREIGTEVGTGAPIGAAGLHNEGVMAFEGSCECRTLFRSLHVLTTPSLAADHDFATGTSSFRPTHSSIFNGAGLGLAGVRVRYVRAFISIPMCIAQGLDLSISPRQVQYITSSLRNGLSFIGRTLRWAFSRIGKVELLIGNLVDHR